MSLDPTEYDLSELRRLAGIQEGYDSAGEGTGVTDGGSDPLSALTDPEGDGAGIPGSGPGPGGDRPPGFPGSRSAPGGGDRDGIGERILTYHTSATEEMLARPYLPRLPDTYTGVAAVFEWLQFLVATGGERRAREMLSYYESIDWIGEQAREELETYMEGMNDPDPGSDREFEIEDHRRSLLYVARLTAETYS